MTRWEGTGDIVDSTYSVQIDQTGEQLTGTITSDTNRVFCGSGRRTVDISGTVTDDSIILGDFGEDVSVLTGDSQVLRGSNEVTYDGPVCFGHGVSHTVWRRPALSG